LYTGDANNAEPLAVTNEAFTVGKASPALTTAILQPTGAVAAGAVTVQDRATLSGGALYTGAGTLNFVLEDSSNAAIPGTSFLAAVSDNGSFDTTPATVSLGAGTYHWVVSFTGDANNAEPPAVTDETFTVGKASPALTTTILQPTGAVAAGDVTVQDRATLSGGALFTGLGTLNFVLEDSSNAAITGTSFSTPVSDNGSFDTPATTVSLAGGTYHWVVSFTGDANNAEPPAVTDETFTVNPTGPAISTTPSPSTALLGATLQDVAVLAGGFDPTGSITFRLYAPGVDPTVGPVAYTETVTGVNGNGTYHTTVGFVSNAPGIWHWVATYNGDVNNNPVASGPLDEPVTIEPFVPPTIVGKLELLGSSAATALADAVFLNRLYEDVLGRAPDLPGLNGWFGLLLAGVPRAAVVHAVWDSPEHRGLEVDHDFLLYLHRPDSPAERQLWVNAFLMGATENQVALAMLTSPEYTAAHPDAGGFVASLYDAVLGRAPSAAEVSAWQQALQAGLSRAALVNMLLTSPEAEVDLVDQDYVTYLGHPPDPASEQAWVALLQAGALTPEAVTQAILASDEYFARAP
jgi:hypothetical protein